MSLNWVDFGAPKVSIFIPFLLIFLCKLSASKIEFLVMNFVHAEIAVFGSEIYSGV